MLLLWGGAEETEAARLLETAVETEEEATNPAFEIEEAVPSGGFSSCLEEEVDVLDAVEAAGRGEPSLAGEVLAAGAEQAAVNIHAITAMAQKARNFIKPPKGNGKYPPLK